jgi:hypothetical protein
MMEKEKILIGIIIIPMVDAVVLVMEILLAEDAEEVEEAAVVAVGEETIVSIYRILKAFNCGKKGHYSTDCSIPRKNKNERSDMVSKDDFKNLLQTSMKEMLTKND